MKPEFRTASWDQETIECCRRIIQLGLDEDLGNAGDITTRSVGIHGLSNGAALVSRKNGVLCGQAPTELLFEEFAQDASIQWLARDGQSITAGQCIAKINGEAGQILRLERTALNIIGRLCGIATLTSQYVKLVAGTNARVFDTRKTTPGWRMLEKYAVHCGGGSNHRMGLYDAVLVKDNHLWLLNHVQDLKTQLSDTVPVIRKWIDDNQHQLPFGKNTIVEIEVDTLDQFQKLLPTSPDIILLDNMNLEQLREAVTTRNSKNPRVQLEASGGVNLDTIAAIAATGVDRISIGALTHSALNFDVGLDWKFD